MEQGSYSIIININKIWKENGGWWWSENIKGNRQGLKSIGQQILNILRQLNDPASDKTKY